MTEMEWMKLPPMSEDERVRRMVAIETRVAAHPVEACDHCGQEAQCIVTRDPRDFDSDATLWCRECFVKAASSVVGEPPTGRSTR